MGSEGEIYAKYEKGELLAQVEHEEYQTYNQYLQASTPGVESENEVFIYTYQEQRKLEESHKATFYIWLFFPSTSKTMRRLRTDGGGERFLRTRAAPSG